MIITSKIFKNNPVKKGQKRRIIAEIYVDEVSELPTKNGIDGYELCQGSVAYVIRSGELYVMDNKGEWYSSSGEKISAYTTA